MGERAGVCVCVGGRGVRARRDSWMRRQIEIPPSHSVPLPSDLPSLPTPLSTLLPFCTPSL